MVPFAAVFAVAALQAVAPVPQPDSIRYVAAVEIALRTPADRSDLLAMLRRHATAGGLHVDDSSREFRELAPELVPDFVRRTLYVGVWRGAADDDLEISVDDAGHRGRAWVIFSRGKQPALARRMREGLLSAIAHRWPGARRLPVLPSGGLPLAGDLRLGPDGYRIARSAASGYELPATSPLVAPR
ncbi:MAG TPA: hypothetical protein VGO55_05020 [Allosphingosinicella sp.]|jgi:hypothetical protein|nr:hypothetical protein [Allosphingosinicella sp.]